MKHIKRLNEQIESDIAGYSKAYVLYFDFDIGEKERSELEGIAQKTSNELLMFRGNMAVFVPKDEDERNLDKLKRELSLDHFSADVDAETAIKKLRGTE